MCSSGFRNIAADGFMDTANTLSISVCNYLSNGAGVYFPFFVFADFFSIVDLLSHCCFVVELVVLDCFYVDLCRFITIVCFVLLSWLTVPKTV